MSRFLNGLNPRQRAVAEATEGPVLALAGAGTGKTHTVIARIANIISWGTRPENILAVTFTNKAAAELKDRLKKTLGSRVDLSNMIASTFHSLCVQIIRRDCGALGYRKSFSIADQGEQYSIVRKASRFVHGCQKLKPDEMLSQISRLKSRGLSPEQFSLRALEDWEMSLASVYRKYQEALRLRNVMDFDDLLLKAVQLLREHAPAREYWQERFRYIVVDEFQDTSEIQYDLVCMLAGKWRNLCVVGDDDQSIYSWRGAVPRNIIDFPQKWQGSTVVHLEENYRSTNNILKCANAVIANNTDRHEKALWSSLGDGLPVRLLEFDDQDDEAQQIISEINNRIRNDNCRPSDFAIIVRANALTRPFEAELKIEKIPYEIVGGQSFFDRKEVRDMLSFLSLVANPSDDGALLRVINTPARGIGDKTVEKLTQWAGSKRQPLQKALQNAAEIGGIPAAAVKSCNELSSMIREWEKLHETKGGDEDLVARIIRDIKYVEEVEHMYDDPLQRGVRMELAAEVGDSLRQYLKSGSIEQFLQEATLGWKEKGNKKSSDDTVKLITIHSAKGLEYPVVYIAGVEEKILPHRNSEEENTVDEERRLFYVAMTRARRELTLSRCINRLLRGQKSPRDPSRFLHEIPAELLQRTRMQPIDAEEKEDAMASIRAMLEGIE